MPKAFISYAPDGGHGETLAVEIQQQLLTAGFAVFRDVIGLKPGDVWYHKLEFELESSDVMVLVVSEKVSTSKWVHNEVSMAEEIGIPVIPVLAEKVRYPLWLRHLQVLDFCDQQDWALLLESCITITNYSRSELNFSKILTSARELSAKKGYKIYAARILLVGPGGAGKSSLAGRLQGKDIEQVKCITAGIEYQQHQPLILQKISPEYSSVDKKLNLYLWDFGGQTIFHGLHSAFLHENCVYILVVDSRHEQAPDEWLYQIRHLAGSQAKVLLVTNWYEQCETHQNKTRLLREFPNLLTEDSFFYFSCIDKNAMDFKRFVKSLIKASLDSQKMVLKETLDVQRALEKRYQDNIFLDSENLDTVIEEITGNYDTDNRMAKTLEQLGFLVVVEKGNDRYCLKPAWAVDNAYKLLYSPELRQANGIVDLKILKQVLKNKQISNYPKVIVYFSPKPASIANTSSFMSL